MANALVNGTNYQVGGGKALIGGTVYSIEQGKTLIDGTAVDIVLKKTEYVTVTIVNGGSGYNTNRVKYTAPCTLRRKP